MARPSRNELFIASFSEFMHVLEEAHQYEIRDWTCKCTTVNKRSCSHRYDFIIPYKRVLYEVDIPTFSDGVWTEPGPVYETQILPSIESFNAHFNDYFKSFELEFDQVIMSFVNFDNLVIDNVTGFRCKIIVVYHKHHMPFPITVTPLSHSEVRLMNRIQILNEEIAEQNNIIHSLNMNLKRVLKKSNNRTNIIDKLKCKMREQYADKNVPDDCPVCYETITPDKLNISNCCHYTCMDCISRCSACPLCREKH